MYFGADNKDKWHEHDATEIMLAHGPVKAYSDILIDQGLSDGFLEADLRPGDFEEACKVAISPLIISTRES